MVSGDVVRWDVDGRLAALGALETAAVKENWPGGGSHTLKDYGTQTQCRELVIDRCIGYPRPHKSQMSHNRIH